MKRTELEEEVHTGESILQELYIEVFAVFIPGFICVAGFSFLFALIIHVMLGVDGIKGLGEHLAHTKWIIFFTVLVFSYAAGAIIYRKGPKQPDRIAAFLQWNETNDRDKNCLAVQLPEEKKSSIILAKLFPETIASRKNKESEYPYRNTREYLIKRGLWHLTIFIPWCVKGKPGKAASTNAEGDESGEQEDKDSNEAEDLILYRSKHYINILKERIKLAGNKPYIVDVVRNEGHIRLLASLWHALKLLHFFSFITFLVITVKISADIISRMDSDFVSLAVPNDTPKAVPNDAPKAVPNDAPMAAPNDAPKAVPETANNSLSNTTYKLARNIVLRAAHVISGNPKHTQTSDSIDSVFYSKNATIRALILLCAFVFLTEIGKRNIQKSIHYVRSREIVSVLEKAYQLAQKGLINVKDFYERNQDVFSIKGEYASCEECKRCFYCSQSRTEGKVNKDFTAAPCMFTVEDEWKNNLNPVLHRQPNSRR